MRAHTSAAGRIRRTSARHVRPLSTGPTQPQPPAARPGAIQPAISGSNPRRVPRARARTGADSPRRLLRAAAAAALALSLAGVPPAASAAQLSGSGQEGAAGHAAARTGGDGDRSAPLLSSSLAASQETRPALGSGAAEILGPGMWHETEQGKTWYGAYRTFPSVFAYCVDAGLRTPRSAHFPTEEPAQTIETAETAWALAANHGSASADVQAALSALVKFDEAIPHRHAISPRHPRELGEDFRGAAAAYRTMTEEAAKFAGPYALEVELVLPGSGTTGAGAEGADAGGSGTDGSAAKEPGSAANGAGTDTGDTAAAHALVSLTSASGAHVSGASVHLDAEGATAAGTVLTTGEEPSVVALTDLVPGTVTVSATARNLPAASVRLHRPEGEDAERVQSVVTPGEPLTAEGSARAEHAVPEPAPSFSAIVPTVTAEPSRVPEPSAPAPEPSFSAIVPTVPGTHEPSTQPSSEPPAPDTAEPEEPEAAETEPSPEETPQPTARPSESAPSEEPAEPRTSDPGEEDVRSGHGDRQATPAPAEDPSAAPASLPRTGAGTSAALGLALMLIGIGGFAISFTRRR
ncbi:hypothetical protein [Brevibacterium album]|uniref:hypothetical protein n=1 Tax=Brevibacterium album TaxID=417948 RepID=UPI00048CE303|nr:hypothetical protein [Brevibacterium album]